MGVEDRLVMTEELCVAHRRGLVATEPDVDPVDLVDRKATAAAGKAIVVRRDDDFAPEASTRSKPDDPGGDCVAFGGGPVDAVLRVPGAREDRARRVALRHDPIPAPVY